MKKFTLFIAVITLLLTPGFLKAQNLDRCLTEILFQEQAKHDPSLMQNRLLLEQQTEEFIKNNSGQKLTVVPKIIPVVFHVIHEGGTENISKAQIQDQIASLTDDFRRLHADTVDTPPVFQTVAADVDVEFRLAQLDPNGNCTDGIVRVFSHLTNNARNNVKALSYWPSNKYLNVWLVKSIENTGGTGGIVIGFAQFPGGSSATDGVVLRHDYTGRIGTAAGSGNAGRVMSHEVGHWLNLRHINGDANCASDLVADTPTQDALHFGCPNHPYHVNQCGFGTSPNGEMFQNYMDYTDGDCMNIFTNGQSARMNAALSSPVSGRNNLWTTANNIATGTDGTPAVTCVPVADFASETKMICEGTTLNFVDGSWNGDPVSWDWQFPGGTPGNSTSQNPTVQYNTPGIWDVSLTVTNSAGSNTKTATAMIIVSSAGAAIMSYPFNEGFEGGSFPINDWFINNENTSTNTWEQTTIAAHTGSNSVRIYNYSGNVNGIDAFITSSFNLSYVTQTKLVFWRAFAYRSAATTDQLKVYSTTTCGQLWSLRYTKSGIPLSTAGQIASVFVPTASQWDADTVNLSSTSVSTRPNVRFKFEYIQDTGNNIYIDDINLDGIVGVNENEIENFDFDIIPNPAIIKAQISFTLEKNNDVSISVLDITGRIVQQMNENNLPPDDYVYDVTENLQNGVYFVRLTIGNFSTVKKLVLQ